MIVLDEQLLGRQLEIEIARWYPGSVQFIIDLRPATVIKDDAIPGILRRQASPTFVTINVRDFWQKFDADIKYCIICVALPDHRAGEIPELLRTLFRGSGFATKRDRMGKIIRLSAEGGSYYSSGREVVEISMRLP